jgi:hypothetical protein
MSYGMPDQAAEAFSLGIRAARIARLILVLLVATMLTVLVLLTGQINTVSIGILAIIWALALLIISSGFRRGRKVK